MILALELLAILLAAITLVTERGKPLVAWAVLALGLALVYPLFHLPF